MANMEVTYIDHCGDDLSVVNAARVSFDKESQYLCDCQRPYDETNKCYDNKRDGCGYLSQADQRLIQYLAREKHTSPFNHTFLSFRVKAPIVVARQLVKHEYMPWNEVSRRYVKTLPEFYHPPVFRRAAENVKQGSSEDAVDMGDFCASSVYPVYLCTIALDTYNEMLRIGVCPEQARMYLPQNMMTEWIWSGTLFAWSKMLNLRLDHHTQAETRLVAELIEPEVARLFPVSWKALKDG